VAFVSGFAGALSGTGRVVSAGGGDESRRTAVVSRRGTRTGAGGGVATGGRTGAGRGLTVSGSPLRTDPPACGWWNSIGWRNAVAIARP